MKLSMKFFALIAILLITSILIPKKLSAQGGSVSFQVFYDNLSPYGEWVDYPNYGYIWVPSAGPDFIPYSTGGYWAWTDYGWTWVSDFDWGWAPFHYGRWDYDDYYGWFWMPDTEWGPAWVSWRRCEGYYGWAPLGPNVSIDVAFSNNYIVPNDHWVFVNERYLGRHDIHNYYGPRNNNSAYINNSTVINNTYIDNSRHTTYIAGPKKEDVQKSTGAPVKQFAIKENSRPGQVAKNNQLTIYRPAVVKKEEAKPSRIADKKEVLPIAQRKAITQPADKNNVPPVKQNENNGHTNPAYTNPNQKTDRQQQKPAQAPNNKTTTQPLEKKQRNDQQPKVKQEPGAGQQKQQNIPKNNPQPIKQNPAPIPKEHTHQDVPKKVEAPPVPHPHQEVAPQQPQPMPQQPRQQQQPVPQPMPQQQPREPHRPH